MATQTNSRAPRIRNPSIGADLMNTPAAKDDFSVLLKSNRLHINATVDADGVKRLKQILDKYSKILKLMQ